MLRFLGFAASTFLIGGSSLSQLYMPQRPKYLIIIHPIAETCTILPMSRKPKYLVVGYVDPLGCSISLSWGQGFLSLNLLLGT